MRNIKLNYIKLIMFLGISSVGTSFGLATITGPNPYPANPAQSVYNVNLSPAQNMGFNSNIAFLLSNITGQNFPSGYNRCTATILNSTTFITSSVCVNWQVVQPPGTLNPQFKLFLPSAQQSPNWITDINNAQRDLVDYSTTPPQTAISYYGALGVNFPAFRNIGLYYTLIPGTNRNLPPLIIFKIIVPNFYYNNNALVPLIPTMLQGPSIAFLPVGTFFYGFGGGQGSISSGGPANGWFRINNNVSGMLPAGSAQYTAIGSPTLTQTAIRPNNNLPMICQGDVGGPIINVTNNQIYGIMMPRLARSQCAIFIGNGADASLNNTIFWFDPVTVATIWTTMNYTPAQAQANMRPW